MRESKSLALPLGYTPVFFHTGSQHCAPFGLLTQLAVQNRASILPYTTALPKGSRYLTTSAYLSMNTPRSSLCMVLYALTTELFSPAPVCRSHPFLLHYTSRVQLNFKYFDLPLSYSAQASPL